MHADQDLSNRFKHHALLFHRPRAANMTFLVQFGSAGLITRVRDGAVTDIDAMQERPPLASVDFVVQAPTHAWNAFWQPIPAAGSHDIFALMKQGLMNIQGNLHPLMSNLQFMKDLLAVGRGTLQ